MARSVASIRDAFRRQSQDLQETLPNFQEVISREHAGIKAAMRLGIHNAIQVQAPEAKEILAEQVRQAVKESMGDSQPQNQDCQPTLGQFRDIQKIQDAQVSLNCNVEGQVPHP